MPQAQVEKFLEDGFVTLDAVVSKPTLRKLQSAITLRYGGLSEEELEGAGTRVGHERYMYPVELSAPFDSPQVYANDRILQLAKELLGSQFILRSYSAVIAYPGAHDQHVHLDHWPLFEDKAICFRMPPFAITMVVPLIDLSAKTGATRLWMRSHRRPTGLWNKLTSARTPMLRAGDAFVMDYRLIHGGTANRSPLPRPILYIVYSRPWFEDIVNFKKHPPLLWPERPSETLQKHRSLFANPSPRSVDSHPKAL